jgi:hypothetical protein
MEPDGRAGAAVRRGLIATLVITIGLSFEFFRPSGFDGDDFGALLGAELLSIIALVLLLAFLTGNRRLAAAGVTFVAAFIPTCEGVAVAVYPDGSPTVPPSSVPLVVANLAVMVLAALNFREDERGTMVAMLASPAS